MTPLATYRLQLHKDFPFAAAAGVVPYLDALGVSDVYASPIVQARLGSTHGYDTTASNEISGELGGASGFDALSAELRGRGMGLLLDIVPNHMAASTENAWWIDVLRHGPASRYAPYFDIDWEPARPGLANKVLLPVLRTYYGEALEAGEIVLAVSEPGIVVDYHGLRLPLSPGAHATLLDHALEALTGRLEPSHPSPLALAAVAEVFRTMSSRAETELTSAFERTWRLYTSDDDVRAAIDDAVRIWNGTAGDRASFDRLDALLDAQSYRVALWRVANQEINYRRFFAINDLVAVRVEDEQVFDARHELVLRLLSDGGITGLRIDHVDGLHDPERYLARLRERVGADAYVVVEKILARDEPLPDWPVQGTTGYDFMDALNGVFVDADGLRALGDLRRRLTDADATFDDVVYATKRRALVELLGGELRNLAARLGRLAEQHRHGRDLTLAELGRALVAVTACLDVYRTYVAGFDVAPRDRAYIEAAVDEAVAREPANARACRFFGLVLLLDLPPQLAAAQREIWLRFVMRWQQVASAAMAKGCEDSAFYQYSRLISLNEVGSDPAAEPLPPARFHERMNERAQRHPLALSATSTHDTKRSEDVRARIDVLSELPESFARAFEEWREWNGAREVRVNAKRVPDGDIALLVFQTLLGGWPAVLDETWRERLSAYVVKAAREAAVHTGWEDPDDEYEHALVEHACAATRARDDEMPHFARLREEVALYGAVNSLAQTAVKMTAPGVPDLYQGTELWDLSLVDPDNRRPVDYDARRAALAQLDGADPLELLGSWRDGRVKLHVIRTALRCRAERRELFASGAYEALAVRGAHAEHVIAFARTHGGAAVVTIVPRLGARMAAADRDLVPPRMPLGDIWGDTTVALPPDVAAWRDALTGGEVAGGEIALADALAVLPVAILTSA